jgi:hypothetical protein
MMDNMSAVRCSGLGKAHALLQAPIGTTDGTDEKCQRRVNKEKLSTS